MGQRFLTGRNVAEEVSSSLRRRTSVHLENAKLTRRTMNRQSAADQHYFLASLALSLEPMRCQHVHLSLSLVFRHSVSSFAYAIYLGEAASRPYRVGLGRLGSDARSTFTDTEGRWSWCYRRHRRSFHGNSEAPCPLTSVERDWHNGYTCDVGTEGKCVSDARYGRGV